MAYASSVGENQMVVYEVDKAERSLHDAIVIVRSAMKNYTIISSGSVIDKEISKNSRQHA